MRGVNHYNGWEVLTFHNEWLTLSVAPDLGGRLVQLEMGGYPFFFVNPFLRGFIADDSRLGKDGTWLNYGGEKIWVAPQGWNDPEFWPGPPDPVLDGGVFSCKSQGPAILLTSPCDAYTGLQVSREIRLLEKNAALEVKVRFTNQSTKPRKWAVWPVCQIAAPDVDAVKLICPVNPQSAFSGGYKVVHGLVNNPQFGLNQDGHFQVDYQYLVGKAILDADEGWVAAVNRGNGKVLLMCYDFKPGQPYPDGASVHLWTQGKGMIYSRNRITEFRDDFTVTFPYMEIELVSPLSEISPGRFFEFDYQLRTTTIAINSTVKKVTKAGVVAQELFIQREATCWRFLGEYGLFQRGTLRLVLQSPWQVLAEIPVCPLEAANVNVSADSFEAGIACRFVLEFWDENSQYIDILDDATC